MEKKLKAVFDFQKFQGNKRLAKMIAEAEQSMDCELDDDDLSFVAGAGESCGVSEKEDKTDDT